MDHHERVLDAPVGGVGDVRHPRQTVEGDVVAAGDTRKTAHDALSQLCGFLELALERIDRLMRCVEKLRHLGADLFRIRAVLAAARFNLAQPMTERLDQRVQPFRIVEHVILQVGVALHHPDVAEHLIEHARRASGAALAAQLVELLPNRRAEQADDDLAVGERRVVVGDLAQARAGGRKRSNRLHLERVLCWDNDSIVAEPRNAHQATSPAITQ